MYRSSVPASVLFSLAGYGRIRRLRTLLIASTALVGVVAPSAQADEVIDGGTTEEVNGAGGGTQPSPWNVGDNLRVGNTSAGTLNILNGGEVDNLNGTVGFANGSTGEVTVTGTGSSWTNTGILDVGLYGGGALNIEDGGAVDSSSGRIGNGALATGEATITGAGSSWTNSTNLTVGGEGTGTLNIADGGSVGNVDGIIATLAGSTGTATVTGTGSSWTNSGELTIGNGGAGTLDIEAGGTVASDGGIIGRQSSATGDVTVTGAGSSWTSTNNIIVGFDGAGTIDIADGATVGSDSGSVGFSAGVTGEAVVTGAGSSWTNTNTLTLGYFGNGTLTVSDGATVGADWTILGSRAGATGTLNIGAASGDTAMGAGTVNTPRLDFLDGTGTLVFNHTDTAYGFGADISGNGTILHEAGTTLFSGDSSGFTGTFDLTGGTIGGNGILGGTLDVGSGATVAPGNSVGTLNVTNATFNTGSVYEVELNDGGFTAGTNNDLLNAGGTVTIDGGTVHVTPENGTDDGSSYTAPGTYTIVTAGSVTGTFDSPTATDDYVFLDFVLAYDASNVYLNSQRAAFFSDIARTPNQRAVAGPLTGLGAGNAVYDAMIGLVGGAHDARAALDALSGEIHASVKTALLEDSRFAREAALDRLGDADASGKPYGFWTRGFGSWADWDSDGNAAELDRSIGGIFFGGDMEVANRFRLGAFGGYADSRIDVDDRTSSATVQTWNLGVYGGGSWNGVGLSAGGSYAWHDIDADRMAAFSGFSNSLSADYNARSAQVFSEAAYRLSFDTADIEPFVKLAYVHLKTDAYDETGGAAALAASSQTAHATFTTLGLRGEHRVSMGQGTVRLTGSGGWRHAFGHVPTTRHAFASGSTAFTVAGVPVAGDAFVFDFGAATNLAADIAVGLSYGGRFGDGFLDQGLSATITVPF
ncbi:outer membrane autotransporter protein [Parvibaculum indicum]|uniref:autotransporter outer membrane beta-barrel domain-containing protein n=1 Tax=Parvibaculum indicum TaxID=562969 RepID=UPI0014241C94|nr:autotransporter domain-containing protein [Parvibaculum indicum]NIJ42096.1 outer membrane autotransporter protein [Parvibaculum indicum]